MNAGLVGRFTAVLVVGVFCHRSGAEVALFRIQSPDSTLLACGPDGQLMWSNSTSPQQVQIQCSDTLEVWHDYVEITATSALHTARVWDPATPTDMALIPAGSFVMGATTNLGHEGYANEVPQHRVQISAFYLDRTEVSKSRWDEVAAWALIHGYDVGPASAEGRAEDQPAVKVNWHEAVKWCNARSEKEGLMPCYSSGGSVYRTGQDGAVTVDHTAAGYRLPSEAEWEKAARGGARGHRFPWPEDDQVQHKRANYFSFNAFTYDSSPTRNFHPDFTNDAMPYTSPVASFAANGYGLFDMAGNVWEWCGDWHNAAYYGTSPAEDPRGAASGSCRTLRGGSWGSGPDGLRVALRCAFDPTQESTGVGFRCARRP